MPKRFSSMGIRRNRKNNFISTIGNFRPIITRRPYQGMLNFNSWQAGVFIEILGAMLVEQEFIDLVLDPITDIYAEFIKNGSHNIWTISYSNRLMVRAKYRRQAQRLTELLGAILTKHQFIFLILKPIIKTYINIYTQVVLGETKDDDDQYRLNETCCGSEKSCSIGVFPSAPYKKFNARFSMDDFDENSSSSWENSLSALLPYNDSSDTELKI